MSKKFSKVWIAIFAYVVVYFLISILFQGQDLLWLELSVFSLTVSVILLAKHRFPKRKYLVLSSVLTLLLLVSNIWWFNAYNVFQGIVLFLTCSASCSVFEKYEENTLKWIKCQKKRDVFESILIGIACGIAWGGINYLLMKGSNPVAPANVFKAFVVSLNPAILEEVAYRSVFFAFCLSMAEGEFKTGSQKFVVWCMMTVPHVLPHMPFSMANGAIQGVIEWFIYLALYVGVFGFIFAFLQRKRDVSSAMIAHGVVDWIRFCIFGIPM